MKIDQSYDLKDLWIVPRHLSEINSRNDVNTTVEFCGQKLSLPLIASPMPDVCDGKMAIELSNNGLFGFIHRFMTIDEQKKEYHYCLNKSYGFNPHILNKEKEIKNYNYYSNYGVAIGINNDWYDRFLSLLDYGVCDYILDTANGFNTRVTKCIEKMLKKDSKINIIAGNVCTKEGYRFLAQYPLEAIRCLIGSGSACSTRHETAVYFSSASSLIEIIQEKNNGNNPYSPLVIADGGINNPHDFCIALALGADLCMAGKIFAQCLESPAKTLNIDGKIKKIYRGAASFSNQIDYTGERPNYIEGFEQIIDYNGKLTDVIKRFSGGLRSSMSYVNAQNLEEFKEKSNFCISK